MDDSALSTAIIEAIGHTAVRHVDGEKLLSRHAQECCVDGVHPTDLGFMEMADNLEPVMRRLLNRG